MQVMTEKSGKTPPLTTERSGKTPSSTAGKTPARYKSNGETKSSTPKLTQSKLSFSPLTRYIYVALIMNNEFVNVKCVNVECVNV